MEIIQTGIGCYVLFQWNYTNLFIWQDVGYSGSLTVKAPYCGFGAEGSN